MRHPVAIGCVALTAVSVVVFGLGSPAGAGGFGAGSGSITVAEEDGSPSVSTRSIKFTDASLTDNGDGTVSVDLAAGTATPTLAAVLAEGNDTPSGTGADFVDSGGTRGGTVVAVTTALLVGSSDGIVGLDDPAGAGRCRLETHAGTEDSPAIRLGGGARGPRYVGQGGGSLAWVIGGDRMTLSAAGALELDDGSSNTASIAPTATATTIGSSAGVVSLDDSGYGPNAILARMQYEAHTAGDTLTAGETGSVHSNAGASGAITIILPTGVQDGTTYTFVGVGGNDLNVDPNGADNFAWSGGAMDDGEYLTATNGTFAVVYDASETLWLVLHEGGTLAEETP